jgi:cobalamin biosynthesis protein CobT
MEDTNDYAALRVAHDMLMSRKEPRRAVFVISDGCGNVPAMKQQIAAGQGLGITTLGVGICLDVSRIYGAQNCVTVNDPQDLGTAAFSKMKMAA